MVDSLFKTQFRNFTPGKDLPRVSTTLDSVRAYQFEAQFFGLPSELIGQQTDLTLAAKQVSPIGFTTDDIVVHRLNDQVFYPGKPSPEELTITFDNLYLRETAQTLWRWFKGVTYDPITGDMTPIAAPGGSGNKSFKANKLRVIQLDNTRTPHAAIELYGVYPKSYRLSEHNYSTNEFHTIEVVFRYDFMDYFNYASGRQA